MNGLVKKDLFFNLYYISTVILPDLSATAEADYNYVITINYK